MKFRQFFLLSGFLVLNSLCCGIQNIPLDMTQNDINLQTPNPEQYSTQKIDVEEGDIIPQTPNPEQYPKSSSLEKKIDFLPQESSVEFFCNILWNLLDKNDK